jgi:DNA invertase Pin-like site-specific DNA recombinase
MSETLAHDDIQRDKQGQPIFKRDGSAAKKRGRKPGQYQQTSAPYFPEKVETVRRMLAQKKSFTEIGLALGISRAGAYYIWQRWIAGTYKG